MNANKINGAGTISFNYQRYGSDAQGVTWRVEYSTNNGSSFTQAGSDFTGSSSLQTFSATVNIVGNVRIRIRHVVGGNLSTDRRLNIDDIQITDYLPTSYTVSFNGNGSTGGSMSNQTASAATNLTSNAFTRTGYTFAGWNTVANGTGTSYANGASFPFTANTTLFAQWTPNNLTVTYDTQGGSAIANGSTTTGGQIAASPGTPTRAGYSFNGWFTASSGGTAISFPYTHNQTGNFTLYAQWTLASSPTLKPATLSSALSNVNGTASTGLRFTASGHFLIRQITVPTLTG